jgi:hypothetical protein
MICSRRRTISKIIHKIEDHLKHELVLRRYYKGGKVVVLVVECKDCVLDVFTLYRHFNL